MKLFQSLLFAIAASAQVPDSDSQYQQRLRRMAEAQSESEQRAEEIRKAANWYMVDQARLRREAQEQRERQSRREVTPSGRAMGWIFLLGFLALLVGGYAYEIHKAVRRKPAG